MILLFWLFSAAWAQTDVVLGQYFHAKAEVALIEYFENKGQSIATLLGQQNESCSSLNEFQAELSTIKNEADATLNDFKNNGFRWRQPQTYGQDEKILMPKERAIDYVNERLRFLRLETFGRLSRLAPGCLEKFRQNVFLSQKSNNLPRFRLESLKNASEQTFCSVSMRYWRELYTELGPECRQSAEE